MKTDRIIRWGLDLALVVAYVAQAFDNDLWWTVRLVESIRASWLSRGKRLAATVDAVTRRATGTARARCVASRSRSAASSRSTAWSTSDALPRQPPALARAVGHRLTGHDQLHGCGEHLSHRADDSILVARTPLAGATALGNVARAQ